MIGVGFYLVAIIRFVTFVVVIAIKIKQAEDQSEETKNKLKFVGGLTLVGLFIFALIQFIYWIDTNEVFGRQISWIATFLIFGIGIPVTIISTSQKMTEYCKEYLKDKIQEKMPCLDFSEEIDETQSQIGSVPTDDSNSMCKI